MGVRVCLVSLALSSLAGCGGVLRRPFTCPEKGGPAWTEVTSPHFTLTTDLDRGDAERVSGELETMLDALSTVGFGAEYKPSSRLDVVYFRRSEEYRAIAPKMSGGVFHWAGRHDFERTPVAMLYGDFVNRTREVFLHEISHFLLRYFYPQAPVWLDEGYARYLETLEVKDGVATVGRATNKGLFWNGPWSTVIDPMNPAEWGHRVPVSAAPSATALTAMTADEFYGDRDADPDSAEGQAAFRVMIAHYASAWSLVYFLSRSPEYEPAFDAYLDKLQAGQSNDDAWRATVGQLDSAKLDASYRASLAQRETLLLRTKYAPPKLPPGQVRPLTDLDVHALFARLRRWDSDTERAAASADLDEAAAKDPTSVGLALVRGYWLYDREKHADATKVLSDAARIHPGDRRLLNALGWVALEQVAVSRGEARAAATRELPPIAAELAPLAVTSAELDLLGRISAAKPDFDGGLSYEKRAIAADPNCVECRSAAAEMLARKGLTRDAFEVASFALTLIPHGARWPALSEQVARYRKRLARAGDAREPANANAPSPPKRRP